MTPPPSPRKSNGGATPAKEPNALAPPLELVLVTIHHNAYSLYYQLL